MFSVRAQVHFMRSTQHGPVHSTLTIGVESNLDIKKGDQITVDYGVMFFSQEEEGDQGDEVRVCTLNTTRPQFMHPATSTPPLASAKRVHCVCQDKDLDAFSGELEMLCAMARSSMPVDYNDEEEEAIEMNTVNDEVGDEGDNEKEEDDEGEHDEGDNEGDNEGVDDEHEEDPDEKKNEKKDDDDWDSNKGKPARRKIGKRKARTKKKKAVDGKTVKENNTNKGKQQDQEDKEVEGNPKKKQRRDSHKKKPQVVEAVEAVEADIDICGDTDAVTPTPQSTPPRSPAKNTRSQDNPPTPTPPPTFIPATHSSSSTDVRLTTDSGQLGVMFKWMDQQMKLFLTKETTVKKALAQVRKGVGTTGSGKHAFPTNIEKITTTQGGAEEVDMAKTLDAIFLSPTTPHRARTQLQLLMTVHG